MIKHFPQNSLLKTYCAGELPASISVIIAAHLELCPHSKQQVEAMTADAANTVFSESNFDEAYNADLDAFDFDSMIENITANTEIAEVITEKPLETTVNGKSFYLPQALRNLEMSNWSKLGKLSRSRVALDDSNYHMSLLHIEAQGSVPAHTHNGFEITLLLDGSFKDEMGEYTKGDFIWLDGEHTHNPITEEGCLCLTVSSDSLHFTQGISKLLNPIGKFIY